MQCYGWQRHIVAGVKPDFTLMRANVSINADGITQPSIEPTPPDGGAAFFVDAEHARRPRNSSIQQK